MALIGCAVQSISSMIVISERVQPLGDNQIYWAFWQIELTFVGDSGICHHCLNNTNLAKTLDMYSAIVILCIYNNIITHNCILNC